MESAAEATSVSTPAPGPWLAAARTPPSMDPVRVINRSLRCFVCGLLGAIPLFGIALAWEAIKLHRQVAAETRERWRPALLHASGALGLAAVILWAVKFGVLALLPMGWYLGLIVCWIWRQYAYGSSREWNPARRYLYWGLALGYGGGFVTVGALAAVWAVMLGIFSPRWFRWLL